MSFPEIQFGICNVCGGKGADYPDPGSADASPRDLTGNGEVLEDYNYKGKLVKVCNVCKNKLIADEESLIIADKAAADERFKGAAGFKNSV